jgi:hypothetical protein
MRTNLIALLGLVALALQIDHAEAREGSHGHSSHGSSSSHSGSAGRPHAGRSVRSTAAHSPRASSRPLRHASIAAGVKRNVHGRIARSVSSKHAFQKQHPCPSTGRTSGACPGYVVDHVTPLKRGGADRPSNMQWQTVEAAKAKDRIE